jgi:hypothetical protein
MNMQNLIMSLENTPKLKKQKQEQEKQNMRVFNLVLYYLSHKDNNLQAQGLQAFVILSSSHFTVYMQDKRQLLKLLGLCKPESLLEELNLTERGELN